MSKPVYRYMRQKQFEKEPKQKLMERLTQMNVIPDILPLDLNPSVQVNINLPEGTVEPGVFIKPEQVSKSFYPIVETKQCDDRVLNDQKLKSPTSILKHDSIPSCWSIQVTQKKSLKRNIFTLCIDSPDVANKTYQQHCHWLL